MRNTKYVHGYTEREGLRLNDQATSLNDIIHNNTLFRKGSLVLEAGCGIGAQTKIITMKNPNSNFISIDLSLDSIREAKKMIANLGITNVRLKQADIYKLPFKNETFDSVIICFVLELLQNPNQALNELKRVLKKGGTMIAIEGDHGSTIFYPDSEQANMAIACQIQLQKQKGGDVNFGRKLYPMFKSIELSDISISPRIVYVDSTKTQLVDDFIKKTFIAMIEGISDEAIFEKGIKDLYRTADSDGVFCYTFFKGFGVKKYQTHHMMKKSKQHTGNIELDYVNEIPIAFCRPDKNKSNNSIAIWLPRLGGNRVTCIKELQKLASYGYFAISIDPWLHGDRMGNLEEDIRVLVFEQFRNYMWQILGITTMNVFQVVDWVIDSFNLNNNYATTGVSMGGDIAIALAGMDTRVSKVAAVASSPNWERPGMTDVMDSTKTIDQGKPNNFGNWLFRKLNPMSNLNSFRRPLKLHVELGELDTHINPQWMLHFERSVYTNYKNPELNIELVINNSVNHLSLLQSQNVIDRAIYYLIHEN